MQMQIVIIVTIVFFVLTLAGTWLARRSAYSWADNERAMGPDGVRTEDAGAAVKSGGPVKAARPTGFVAPGRGASGQKQVVITGFDAPKND